MKALIVGLFVIIAAVFACMPDGLGWQDEVLIFLRGILPVLAFFIGLVFLFLGIVDIKDRLTFGKGTRPEKKSDKENP